MSRGCYVALPRDAVGLSAVSDCDIPDHMHLLFLHLFFLKVATCKISIF